MNVPVTPPEERPPRSTLVLVALGGVAALVLVIGVLLWTGSRGDDELTTPTTLEPLPATTAPADTTVPPDTTMPPDTTVAENTTTTTEPPPPPTTVLDPPSGDTWTATSRAFPDHPFTLARVAAVDATAVYDGEIDVDGNRIRCLAVVGPDIERWQEWCGEGGTTVRFVALAGITPWHVEAGPDVGAVTLERMEPTWALRASGCTSPFATIAGTVGLRAQVTIGMVCVGNDAFVTFAGVLLQEGGRDGGGALLALGDEGWNVIDGGTAVPCAGLPDGIDRCAPFGVGDDLNEAALPIPSVDLALSSPDSIELRDETATVREWLGGAADPDTVEGLLVAQLGDPEAEAPVAVRRAAAGRGLTLIIVDVPAFDDAFLSTSWAVWISEGGLVRATAWETCARGVVGGLCV